MGRPFRPLLPTFVLSAALAVLAGCGRSSSAGDAVLDRAPGMNFCYLAMNTQKAPFTDPRVREAVAYAIDKKRIIAGAYAGYAVPAETPVPPTIPFHLDIPARKRDPERSKALLKEAGLTLPVHVALSHGNNSRPYMPLPDEVAKQIAGDLEESGFQVEIRKEQWSEFLSMTQNGEHQMAILGWSADIADADNFLYVLLDKDNARIGSANNISFYTSEEVHQRLLKARRTYDDAERARLYREAQEIIHRDVPMVPLVYTERMIAYRSMFHPLAVEPVTHPVLRLVEEPRDGRLIFVRGADSKSLDAAAITDGESSKVVEQIYDNLVRFEPGTAEVEPALAESWSHDEEARVWTFKLREGVTFHDGSPLDAESVVNAFERQRDENHPHHFPNSQFAYWADLLGYVEKVEAGPESGTVVFRCSDPAPPFFLQTLAVFAFGIPSRQALDASKADYGRHPVGTGPFRLVRWDQGSEILLERNPDYWGGAPALKQVSFQVTDNATVRTDRLLSGQADLIDNLDPLSIDRLLGK